MQRREGARTVLVVEREHLAVGQHQGNGGPEHEEVGDVKVEPAVAALLARAGAGAPGWRRTQQSLEPARQPPAQASPTSTFSEHVPMPRGHERSVHEANGAFARWSFLL